MSYEDVELMKEVCDDWLKAIDGVMQAVKGYDDARAHYRKTTEGANIRRKQEAEIAFEEKKRGNSTLVEQFQCEYREITDMRLAVKAKIDELNSIKFKY